MINVVFAVDTLDIYSPKYFDEQKIVYDKIHYLENEDLSFKFCGDDTTSDVKFAINCGSEKIVLPVNEFNEKCYFSNYNLEELKCNEFSLEVIYDSSNKQKEITRQFKKEKQSNLANFILSKDFKLLNPVDLSYYLIVLADIRNLESSDVQDAYDLLKNKRNNNYKCWPESSCSLTQTIDILRNLKFAGFPDDSRVLEDGKIYLENNIVEKAKGTYDSSTDINYNFELKFLNNFTSSGDISCDLTVDDESKKTYEYDDNDDREDLFLQKSIDDKFILDCDKNIDEIQLRIFEEKIEEKTYSGKDGFTYELGTSDKNSYDNFDFVLEFSHQFSSNEEIDCDLTIDGKKESFTLDEDSDEEDLILKDNFNDKIVLDCNNDDVDDIYFDIYANLDGEEVYTNEDKLEYEIGTTDSENSFEFRFDMEYEFSSNEKLECKLKIDDGSIKTYSFDEDDETSLVIDDKMMSSKVNLDCDKTLDKLRFRLYDSFGRAQVDDEKTDVKSHSATVPSDFSEYSCIGSGKTCDYSNSIQSLYIYDSDFEKSSDIEKYTSSLIQDHGMDGTYLQDKDPVVDTAKYLLYKDNEELTNYIKYVQNNEGSWGTGTNKIIASSWAVLGLENNDASSEHLEDGKDWIYYNEPINGWGSIEQNGLAYTAIKEKLKPYLVINAQNTIYGQTTFEIKNPTIYDLQDLRIIFSKEIEKQISGKVDLGDLKADEKLTFNLTASPDLLGSIGGEISIEGINHKKEKLVLIKMPIKIIGKMPFSIKEETYSVSINDLNVKLDLTSNIQNYNLTCDYINPFSNSKESILINQKIKNINILNTELKEGDFSINLACKSDKDNFIIPVPIKVIKVDKTFNIENSDITITSDKDFSISIMNLNTDRQTIEISVDGVFVGVIEPTENAKILAKNESREIFFKIINPTFLSALGNNAEGNLVLKGDNGYIEKIPLKINFNADTQTNSSSMVWYIAVGVILLIMFIIFLIRRYRQLNEPEGPTDQGYHEDMMMDDLNFE